MIPSLTTAISQCLLALSKEQTDLEEKCSMIDAEETHGAEWARDPDAVAQRLEEVNAAIDALELLS